MLDTTLNKELDRFQAFAGQSGKTYLVEEIGPFILKCRPKGQVHQSPRARLGLLGLIHGNEVIGLPIINNLLNQLVTGDLEPGFEIIFALGNIEAAQADKRFLESDLNRSFFKDESTTLEEKRAKILEAKVLDQCDYVIDLHQTIEPSMTPFFMFKYSSIRHLALVQCVNPGIPTVVTYESIHQQKGVTTNEYLKIKGAVGITIELGEKGFHRDAHDLGLSICRKAIEVLGNHQQICGRSRQSLSNLNFPLFKLNQSVKVENPGTKLNVGWKNLKKVEKGESVGTSQAGPVCSPDAGYMIFPKYHEIYKIGQELFYLCSPLKLEDLPDVPS